jgi:endonuclease/exonuclease/phosphatase family metal-dependent hydrolase
MPFVLGACAVHDVPVRADPPTVTVMSFNIQHGEGLDGRIDLERIAALIGGARADVVALQEVDRGVARTQRRDLPAELARLTGMEVYFAKNIDYQGGDYGNAVLSRLPIRQRAHVPLTMVGDGEQRGVIRLVFEVGGREVLFLATHLDHRPSDAERIGSVDAIEGLIAHAGRMPVIVAGDFNALPDSRVHRKMERLLTDAWEAAGQGRGFTFPAEAPAERIDYIWFSGEAIDLLGTEVLPTRASDHLPIVSRLRLR